MKLTVIIAAAGKGKRFSVSSDKLFVKVNGKPILFYTIKAVHDTPIVGKIILVVDSANIARAGRLVRDGGFRKVKEIIPGGMIRFDSVKRGLSRLGGGDRYVAVHDGARPLVTGDIIARVFAAARKHGAAIAAVPAKNTVKESDKNGFIRRTPKRDKLWEAQTPQVFRKGLILKAYGLCRDAGDVTDDALLVERLGARVKLIEGSYSNIKITTKEDLEVARRSLSAKTGI